MIFFRIALKDLKNNLHFAFLFIFNLSLGLCGFVSLDIFKHSLDMSLQRHSKAILGGDLAISARRTVSDKEHEIILKEIKNLNHSESKITEMYSMISTSEDHSHLVHIRVIEENYPFYGEIRLRRQGAIQPSDFSDLHKGKVVWVYPEVLIQINAKIGDFISIGETHFRISDVVEEDTSTRISNNVAPRIYFSQNHLSETRLIRKGSVAWYSLIYKIPDQSSRDLNTISMNIFEALDDPQLQVYTHENASEAIGKLMEYLNDFLALAALVALFLSSVGMSFLFHSYLKSKLQEMAILMSFGLSVFKALSIYLIQVCLLGIVGFLSALALGLILLPVLKNTAEQLLPIPVGLQFNTVGVSLLLTILVPLLISIPLILNIRKVNASLLLHRVGKYSFQNWDLLTFLSCLPSVLLFWMLAIWQSHSLYIGTLFCLIFFIATLVLGALAYTALWGLDRARNFSSRIVRWVCRDLCRYRFISLTCFLSLSLGVLLLSLIPQVWLSLSNEIQPTQSSQQPSLFLFDIHEDQKDQLHQLLQEEDTNVDKIMPMVQARLLSVNNEIFDKGPGRSGQTLTREQEREMRFRNRGFNLSWQKSLSESEQIVKGKAFNGVYDKNKNILPEISVEIRFADRMGFRIGDELLFDIEGEEVKGVITSIRQVHWFSFQPNFFIIFQSGVLEDFHKTYIATIPFVSDTKKVQLQNHIVSHLPNISFVNISRVRNKIFYLARQMAQALQWMSVLCVLIGLVVLYSITAHQARTRWKDIGLFKILGTSFSDIQKLFLYQFGIIALSAAFFGLISSLLVSYLLSSLIFYSTWYFSFSISLGIIFTVFILSFVVTYLATRKALKRPVKDLFEN